MKPDTGQLVWGAFRRSVWLLVALIVVGVVSVNVIRQRQGPLYTETAEVILSPTDLAGTVAGAGYVDPERMDETEQALASSRELYERAARTAAGALGTGSELQDATTAEHHGTSITFTAKSDDSERAVAIANAVAAAYPAWRSEVTGRAIDRAIAQLKRQIGSADNPELDEQLARLNVLKTLTSGNVLLVEQGSTASKVRPNPVRDSIIGALLGLLGALVAIGIREAADTRVRSEAEIEELLEVPVVGTVERLPSNRKLVVLGRDSARFGDVYGLLAASLDRKNGDGQGTIIAITSATAQEGKTTTAANLAAALAKRNSDVVLLDLDTRRPGLASVFGIPKSAPGADQVLTDKIAVRAALHEISLNGHRSARAASSLERTAEHAVTPDGNSSGSLRLLPGIRSSNDGVVTHRAQLARLAAEVRRDADFVIIDTPPALATADASEIAKVADMVLVVVRQGRASRRGLTELHRLIRSWPPVAVNAVLVDTVGREEYAYHAPH